MIIVNKCDDALKEEADNIIDEYLLTGYKIYRTSAKSGEGIEELRRELDSSIVCFAGQSAVGK